MQMIYRNRTRTPQTTVAFFLVILIIIALITRWIDIIPFGYFFQSIITGSRNNFKLQESPQIYSSDFNCSLNCSETSPLPKITINSLPESCPEYFRWIHEDLKPWKETGITQEMVEKAKDVANIRITILNGRLYTEKYKQGFQTRDVITIWGILQLLRLYPGRLPDVDLMFECDDKPVIKKKDYNNKNTNASIPPPLFHYCGDESSYDIVFPDWSFWGWPEVNIKPWEILKEELKEGSNIIKWEDREPYAYWKGNTKLGAARHDLVKCNKSEDGKARIFNLVWKKEKKQGFNSSDLASQCTYRYKIYVEGLTWSVSEKYILACDSMCLIVKPRYYDFFTRSLLPTIHYWPINETNKCRSIKFAVEWGNKHTNEAQEIGKAGSKFVQENLRMKYVYDYIFHLLNEYAKLMKYEPIVPEGAEEICSETLICSVKGAKRRFRKHSMVKSPSNSLPCTLPPSYDSQDLRGLQERRENLTKQVAMWEESERANTRGQSILK
ncbi:hypothetical protein ACJIZ3_018451 [Penstemon smallii]|uniref:Glycosyl transferase CAP10 domain-containing protein n=1 Tax=Penstemon smallii TaxID=265156 RepID=A0ABD3SYE3_9LAMI